MNLSDKENLGPKNLADETPIGSEKNIDKKAISFLKKWNPGSKGKNFGVKGTNFVKCWILGCSFNKLKSLVDAIAISEI